MAQKPIPFTLPDEATAKLRQMLRRGKHAAGELRRAHVLLKLHEGLGPTAVAKDVDICRGTVCNVRTAALRDGWQSAVSGKHAGGRPPKITPGERAEITALACSAAPEGHSQWTLRLLADRAVSLNIVETICHETVRVILKKTLSSPT